MFQLLKDPNIDFMGKRRLFLGLSAILVAASIGIIATKGIDRGIEFTGGTELQLKFTETPDLSRIRATLDGLTDSTPVVTTIGDPANNEVYIKLGSKEATDDESALDLTQAAAKALRGGPPEQDRIDLNVANPAAIENRLAASPGVSRTEAAEIARSILALRKERAIFRSLDDLSSLSGMSAEARQALEDGAFFGPFAVRSQSYIGPVIGRELMQKAMGAILGSLLGMLIYIWIRFHIEWGFAAVVALTHDTIITLGLFALFDKELSLPVVAAFLTLVGYSVNDTVVVFDRIRENIGGRKSGSLVGVVNRSINQTLSRTMITSGSTWLVVLGLLIFGGKSLSAFAFVLTIGILIGTYSSIYVASPMVVLWRSIRERKRSAAAVRTPRGPAKKVRANSAR